MNPCRSGEFVAFIFTLVLRAIGDPVEAMRDGPDE